MLLSRKKEPAPSPASMSMSRKKGFVQLEPERDGSSEPRKPVIKRSLFRRGRSSGSMVSDERDDNCDERRRSPTPPADKEDFAAVASKWVKGGSRKSPSKLLIRKMQKTADSPKDVSKFPSSNDRTKSVDGLRQIAKRLSLERPRALTLEEERRITLGDSPESCISDRKLLRKTNGGCSLPSTPDKSERRSRGLRLSPNKQDDLKSKDKDPIQTLELPTLTPFHGYLTSENLAMRSSEMEPALHQVEIPSSEEFYMHSRLCALMDQYRLVDQNFDFETLVATSRMAMQSFVHGNDLDGLTRQHTPIIQSLLECSDDVVLEGFFHGDESGLNSRVEVAVFNNQANHQFIVVYRGTSDQQAKPVRLKETRSTPTKLHLDQQVGVFPAFRDAYFSPDMEAKVFRLLDELSEQHLFCDVVMTGYSFGGALATIAAMRFAASREMMRVSCNVFGSPKVGGASFKLLANSLPNLKVMRVEHSTDPWVQAPDAHHALVHVGHTLAPDSIIWTHVGHTIALNFDRKPPVAAYKFDKLKPVSKNFLSLRKNDKACGLLTYVRSMEQFARLGQTWVQTYCGVGEGVRGADNENRHVV